MESRKGNTTRLISFALALILMLALVPMTMTVNAADSDFVIENGVLIEYKGQGGNVVIPNSVTSIGARPNNESSGGFANLGAFYECEGLTSIMIPESVTKIDQLAFYGCVNLTSVTIPGSVKSIGWKAFSGCKSLTTVIISDGVEEIFGDAFSYCDSLESVTIPSSVTIFNNIRSGMFCQGSLKSKV